jgi:DNA-binding response OmpR family regulator
MSVCVLLVEDDERIGASVQKALSEGGYTVAWAKTGEDAFFQASCHTFDLMILDLCLGGRDGLEILKELRKRNTTLPVLITSARCEVKDRVAGLRAGADDYLSKPFSISELEARLEALLRRNRSTIALRLSVGDLYLDLASRQVKRGDRLIDLTALEFELLELLMRRAHTAVSRDTFAREIWNEVNRATPLDNVIDVHIGRMRKKIDQAAQPTLIHTVRGVGFLLSNKVP